METIFYLSPQGKDANDGRSPIGTEEGKGPWATLRGARDALRKLRQEGKVRGEVEVRMLPGRYPVTETLEFGPDDSHTTFRAEGEPGSVILDGGMELLGLREEMREGRRTWVMEIPEVKEGKCYFRSLFVDGKRRPRARLPKFSPDVKGVKNLFRIGKLRFPEKRKMFDGDHVFQPVPGDFQDWPSLPDAEIVILHYWIETRMGTPRYDPKTGWVTCTRRSVFNLYESFNPKLARYYIDNLKEALTEPGEWYLDRSEGCFYYLPFPEEVLGKTEVVAAITKCFIRAEGQAFNHGEEIRDPYGPRLVEHLRFEGLTFRNGDWYAPPGEMLPHDRVRIEDIPFGSSPQGASHVPGVIEFRWARNCGIDRCTLEHVGFYAVVLAEGCRDCAVTRCRMTDLGAGGVRAGGAEIDGVAADRTGYLTIADNRILDFGKVFQQGIGVLLTHAFHCQVIHNEIAYSCYTGVSCGWSWSYRETISRENRIENNHIHHIGQAVLSDMGGIYTLGVQPGTVIRGNHIHHVQSADYGGWGIYPDQASSHILIEGNWVHDIQGSPLRIHFGRELVVRDNVFARSSEEGLIGVGRVESHIAANLLANVLLGPARAVYEGGYGGDIRNAVRSDANLIWLGEGTPFLGAAHPSFREDVPHAISWEEWCATGNDRRSLIADPKVIETENDLTFPPDSPVFQTGFRARSWAQCGPRE